MQQIFTLIAALSVCNMKIICRKAFWNNLCKLYCPCSGQFCDSLCSRNPWGIFEQKSFCYADCCAAELRNITEIPEIVDIPLGNVRLVVQYTDIHILKSGSLKNDWEQIYLTHSKLTTIESNTFRGLTKLKRLYLYNNLISHIHPEAFKNLENLFILCMYENRITTLYSFGGLESPISLTLFSNRISSSTFCLESGGKEYENKTISDTRVDQDCTFPNIYDLDLKKNNFKTIRKHMFRNFEDLEKINLSGNKLTHIVNGTFLVNTNLKTLHLSDNRITHFTMDSFPETLVRLDLDGNRLMYLQVNMFCKLKNLKFLYLQNNYIKVIDENTFKFNTQLRKLFLQGNEITIIKNETFKYNKILQELHLHNNRITTCNWLNYLGKFIKVLKFNSPTLSNDSCLQKLKCSNNIEEPVVREVKFKLPVIMFGYVISINELSCTFCECPKHKQDNEGINYLFKLSVY